MDSSPESPGLPESPFSPENAPSSPVVTNNGANIDGLADSDSSSCSSDDGPRDAVNNGGVASPASSDGANKSPEHKEPASPASSNSSGSHHDEHTSPASSLSSPEENKSEGRRSSNSQSPQSSRPQSPDSEGSGEVRSPKETFKPHAKEDLSDVSDLEASQDGLGFDEPAEPLETHKNPHDALETELDFEAEEKEEKEGEEKSGGGGEEVGEILDKDEEEEGERSDGEVKDGEDLEEGECTDGDDPRPEETEPRPICRFYNRGQCTWGSNCRFVHPGVTDKGNYCMFDMVRPLVPANVPSILDPRFEKPPAIFGVAPVAAVPEPAYESAWERGLRHAKEMMRKATKRKESDMDFEEKKMNLGLGQEDLDKENDFYTRPASPVVVSRMEETEQRWGRHEEPDEFYEYRHPVPMEPWPARRAHYPPDTRRVEAAYRGAGEKFRTPPEYPRERRYQQGRGQSPGPPMHDKWRDRSPDRPQEPSRYPAVPPESSAAPRDRSRGDEWSDPWMRSKSPSRKARRQSYSSDSSYSSSSRSSSRSSYSSYSSRTRSPTPVKPVKRRPSSESPPRKVEAPTKHKRNAEKKQVNRAPPPPSTPPLIERKASSARRREPTTPPPVAPVRRPMTPPPPPDEKPPRNWSPPTKPVEKRRPSVKKRRVSKSSGTESDDSGSSSEESTSSTESSSSSRAASPPINTKPSKRLVIDGREALAKSLKTKALDALKVSGQKQQIKITLKGPEAAKGSDQLLPTLSRKRPLEPSRKSPSPESSSKSAAASKKTPSRREELLKQLKAVEDAIRRKRFKMS